MPTRVLLVRHGQTYGNIDGLFCGHSETDLTPLGIAQAQALGRSLASAGVTPDAVYASDLTRAAGTARYVLESHAKAPELRLDPGLREMHYGDWEARPGKEIQEQHPEIIRDFFRGIVLSTPGGETIGELRKRTAASLRTAVASHPNKTIMLVSHGNAIMAMLAEVLQLPIEGTWSFAVENTSLTRLSVSSDGRVMLTGFNDTSHTVGLAERLAANS
ncbi:hypothetical protein AYO38_10215 [bacterium SCGC AG-212-C10]|nr:hypothetical protein AYO38_10215 [bacterium SCGC AG-212-C10]